MAAKNEIMNREITLKVTINDANLILSYLANGPHGQVRDIISRLEAQTYAQIDAINAETIAKKETKKEDKK
jgi:hypothetical protein